VMFLARCFVVTHVSTIPIMVEVGLATWAVSDSNCSASVRSLDVVLATAKVHFAEIQRPSHKRWRLSRWW
jgi:hypothetical protein